MFGSKNKLSSGVILNPNSRLLLDPSHAGHSTLSILNDDQNLNFNLENYSQIIKHEKISIRDIQLQQESQGLSKKHIQKFAKTRLMHQD